ncbi:3-oxoacyl-ACP synthase [Weeksella virosa]|uniref:3-oxoacyl-ACP synthase n=1 Tax=Weeksella virosa TaxID=1014 RepID=UPI00255515FC|nr:3-oxoacyl-ACP synthase [Weeksella virosa]MDK7374635.1 3-oxoacyl-ACP synthase [Weeksella virosa]
MGDKQLYIQDYVQILPNRIRQNDQIVFDKEDIGTFADFSKEIYKMLEISYPKFYKMDELSKIAILASEMIFIQNDSQDTALLFCNRTASLYTDSKHQKSISDQENYFPSPSVFVYTLPNVCVGEVSIRYQLQTESAFFVAEEMPFTLLENQTKYLLKTGKARQVLCAWIEYYQENYSAFVYLVSEEGKIPYQENYLKNRYKEISWKI